MSNHRTRMGWNVTRIRTVTVALIAVGSLVLSACSRAESQDGEPAVSVPSTVVSLDATQQTATEVESDSIAVVGTDRSLQADVSDVAFWSGFGVEGVIEWERYSSLPQMTNTATVVVLGSAIGPGPTFETEGDPDVEGDLTGLASLRIQVLAVLAGQLDESSGSKEIVVTGMTVPDGPVAKAPAVLFLRHHLDRSLLPPAPEFDDPRYEAAYQAQLASYLDFGADKYRLVSSQGILVEAAGGTVNPARSFADAVSNAVQGRPLADVMDEIRAFANRPDLAATVADFACCDPAG